jgi:O-6-methylguanine DNA methyltransferase
MQNWQVNSKFLGLLQVTFDESASGLTALGKTKKGAIIQVEMMQSGKPTPSDSKDFLLFQKSLNNYENGDFAAFDELSLQIAGTDFQSSVLKSMRTIKPGSVVTYGELAKLSGNPKAYRAVATVCATNKIPLLIPCHRVVPADYSIGQYASRHLKNGTKLKQELLLHENALDL